MIIEGYLEFENPIPVSYECLGIEFMIKIAGVDGYIIIPSINSNFANNKELASLKEPKGGTFRYSLDFQWGKVMKWPDGSSRIKACKILFPNIEEEKFEEIGNKIVNNLNEWRNLLIDNISIELKQDYRTESRGIKIRNKEYRGFSLFKIHSGSDKRFLPQKELTQLIIQLQNVYFNKEYLQEILDNTSQNKKPLFPFYFFLDAEKAFLKENYRKSILDSATALDVSFSLIIKNKLPFQQNLNKYITDKHNTLRIKRNLLKVLEIKLPFAENIYVKNLDEIRNKVIHGGYYPSESEIQSSLKITADTIYFLFPKKNEI